MHALFRQAANLLLAATVFTWLPGGATAPVLCVEPDGTVRLEAGTTRCVHEGEDAAGVSATVLAEQGCGPCTDVQLGGHAGRLSVSRDGLLPTFSATPVTGAVPALPPAAEWRIRSAAAASIEPFAPPSRGPILRN